MGTVSVVVALRSVVDESAALRFRGGVTFFVAVVDFFEIVMIFFVFTVSFAFPEPSRAVSFSTPSPSLFRPTASSSPDTAVIELAALRAERRRDMLIFLRGVCLRRGVV